MENLSAYIDKTCSRRKESNFHKRKAKANNLVKKGKVKRDPSMSNIVVVKSLGNTVQAKRINFPRASKVVPGMF